ncbi:stalk domain-containing protein [Anaerotignum sp.]|uniref:stalk domain-containing protein n=1 Tax=Anaerotignum sp. TaxID=2039241 RepID=UPI00271521AC|nr:stalk domain-containing protein [Anaerotignum sp.]
MKKSILAAVAGTLLFATVAFAYPPIQVYVDGQAVSFDQAPVIVNDRTLVPMRAIFQALGSEVSWSEPTKTITSTKDGDTLVLTIGETGLYKNGQLIYTMPVPACIMSDRTMVPIRAIAEAFDAEVDWDPVGYVITIFSPEEGEENGYETTVEAEDGTTVLSFKMDFPRSSSNAADKIQKILEDEAKESAKDFIDDYGEKAKKEYEQKKDGGNSFTPYSYIGSYEMTRDNSEMVSFYGTSTQDIGKSDNIKNCFSHTFNARSGAEIELFNLIADSEEEMQEFWNTSFGTLIDEKPESFYADAKKRLEKCMDEVGYYLTEDGIGFYLPPETIAPNETGVVSFTMKFEL